MFFWLNNKSGDFYPVINKYFSIKEFEEVEVIEDFWKDAEETSQLLTI